MSEAVSDVVIASNTGGDGFERVANLNAGMFGTGNSTLVELSYVAMVLIVGYVVHATFRYFLPGFSVTKAIVGALGLRD